jgi:cold shock protein
MQTGTVRWFSDQKGLGFIRQDGGGRDLFAHHANIRMEGYKSLKAGQKVKFEAPSGPETRAASNIRIA